MVVCILAFLIGDSLKTEASEPSFSFTSYVILLLELLTNYLNGFSSDLSLKFGNVEVLAGKAVRRIKTGIV